MKRGLLLTCFILALVTCFAENGTGMRADLAQVFAIRGTPCSLSFVQSIPGERIFSQLVNLKPNRVVTAEAYTNIRSESDYAILKNPLRTQKTVTHVDWIILIAYGLLMLGVGFYFSKRNRNTEDYHLGSRSMNPVMVGLSLFATLMSTLTYLSYPGEMIKYGPVIFASLASFPLVYLIVGWLIIPRFMKMRVTSAYEILEIRSGPGVRVMATFFFLSLRLLWMATIIFATVNTAMVSIFGFDKSYVPLICLIISLVTVVYTSMGGLKAVVITDALQTLILILGAILTLIFVSVQLGSFSAIIPEKMPGHWEDIKWGFDADRRMTVANAILSVFVWYICTAGSDQMAIQRYFSTGNLRSARKTFRISLITNFMVQVLLALVGLALLAYFTQRPDELPAGETLFTSADSLFPRYIVVGLPAGITGLVAAGLLSAAMSSLSSGLNSSSAVINEDVFKRFVHPKMKTSSLRQARIISVIIGLVVTVLCLLVGYVKGNLLEVVIKVVNLFVSPLFVLFFMALFVPFSTEKGTLAGGMISVIIAVLIAFFEIFGLKVLWIMPLSFASGILTGCLFSLPGFYNLETNNSKKTE